MNTLAKHCRAICAALTLFAALSFAQSAAAATFTVNSTGDAPDAAPGNGACAAASGACTLRAAIQEAISLGGADTIDFSVTGTVNLTGALPQITSQLKINGPGSALLTVRRDTGGDYRIFTIISGVLADISGLTVTNGQSAAGAGGDFGARGEHGGGIFNTGTLTLTDVIVTANSTGMGGAAATRAGDGGDGGGIYSFGTLTMKNSVVSANTTGRGGNGQTASGYGGDGGGIYAAGPLKMENCVVDGNVAGRAGDTPSQMNSGGGGGGIYFESGTLTLTNVRISNNRTGDAGTGRPGQPAASGSGGGIFTGRNVAATLTNSAVSGNHTGASPSEDQGYAGGIESGGALTVSGSVVSGNTGRLGGGILNRGALTMTNSTVSGNAGHGRPADGINNSDSTSSLKLTNCTLAENSDAGVAGVTDGATVRNTIIARNGPAGGGPDVRGDIFISQGHNLVGNPSFSTGFTAPGDRVGTPTSPLDPRLGPLADNGGPTHTHALLPGSPALDAGNNSLAKDPNDNLLTTDQRGSARVRAADASAGTPATVDIGAFEFQPSLEDVSDKATGEDTPISLNLFIGDAAAASVTATSGDQSLVPDSNLSLTGSGPVRALTITPAPNRTGAAVITLTVTASNGTASSDTFTLAVNPVNDAPSFTKGADQTVAEDSGPQSVAGWATGVSAGPADESGQTLTFTVTGNSNPGLFSAAPSVGPSGELTYAPAPNANGVATITAVLRDGGGTANGGQDASAPQTFQIAVTAVNDAPVVTVPGTQSAAENTPFIFFVPVIERRVSVSDVDAQSAQVLMTATATDGTFTLSRTTGLTFTAGDGANDATMTFAGTVANINSALDNLSFTPARGFTGTATLTFTANDQGNTGAGGAQSAAGTVNINVLDGGTLQFSATSYSVGEGSGPATITVTRTGGSAGQTIVAVLTGDGTAASGSDYTQVIGGIVFGHGETSRNFIVPIRNDTVNEPDETVRLTLSTPLTGSGEFGTPVTAVLTIVDDDAPIVSFKDASYVFNEGDARATITVARGGDRSQPASVKFQTVDDPAAVPCDPAAKQGDGSPYPQGAAYARCDYATTIETLAFAANESEKQITIPLIDDAHPDGVETLRLRLSEPQGASLGARAEATLTVTDNDAAGQANPISVNQFFVRMQYLDFLSREPEIGEPWTGVLNNCPNVNNTDPNAPSAGCDFILVSKSFFESPELQLKGLYSYLFYRVAFDRRPEYSEIIPDMRGLAGATPADVFARRTQYATSITQRAEFAQLYGAVTNQQYVEALLGRHNLQQITTENPANFEGASQVTLTRQQLIDALNSNAMSRAQVLRAVVQSSEVDAAEYHGAFVSMQYYGYLRRTPEESGYQAWLRVIKQDPQNIRQMVNGFMNSQEYRLRFGQP